MVTWRREDGGEIILKDNMGTKQSGKFSLPLSLNNLFKLNKIQQIRKQKKKKFLQFSGEIQLIKFSFLFVTVVTFRGEVLKLTKISRSEMGSYLCIASNGVPPSVSKRISLNIHCE